VNEAEVFKRGVALALMSRASVNAGLMAVRPAALAPGSGVEFRRCAIRRARLSPARTSRLGLAPRASPSHLARASFSQKA